MIDINRELGLTGNWRHNWVRKMENKQFRMLQTSNGEDNELCG